jgi:hypothetical protein
MADPQGKQKHKFAKTQILRSPILSGFCWLAVVSMGGRDGIGNPHFSGYQNRDEIPDCSPLMVSSRSKKPSVQLVSASR